MDVGEVDVAGNLLGEFEEALGWMGTSVGVVGVSGNWSEGLLVGKYLKSSRIVFFLSG